MNIQNEKATLKAENDATAVDAILQLTQEGLDCLDQGICIIDRHLRFVATNRRFFELLDLPEELARPGMSGEAIYRYNAERGEYGEGEVDELVAQRMALARQFIPHQFERTRPDGTVLEIVGRPLPGGGFVSTFTDVTERRGTDEALREAEERFRTLVEHAPEAVVLLDVETGRFRDANAKAVELFGYSREHLLELGPADLSPLAQPSGISSVALAREMIDDALSGGTPVFEWIHLNRDGREIPCELRLVRLELNGQPLVRGSVTDISERKRTERELQQSTRRLEDFLEASADWLWEIDENLRFTYLSSRFETATGLKRESRYGLTPLDLMTGEENGAAREEHTRVLQAREPFRDFTYRRKDANGQSSWVRVSGIPVFDEDGEFRGYRGTAGDITPLMEAEAQSRRTAQAFRNLAEGSIQGIYVHRDWQMQFANQALADILGYPSLEEFMAIGSIGEFFDPDEMERLREYSSARLRGDDVPSRYEVRYRRRDGSQVWVENLVRIIEWEGERAIQVSVIDIEDRKRFELETVRAKEAAEAASQAKTNFLAMISHELRTPLNAVIGFSELISSGIYGPLGDERYDEYARDIHSSGQHLLHVINSILDIAKIEAGREELMEQSVDLAVLVEESIRLVGPRAAEGNIVVDFEPGDGGELEGDPTKLRQALLNVLSNAVKFSRTGGHVTVALEKGEDDGFVIRTSDRGIGMSEQDIAVALAPFGQVDNRLSRQYEGTGLGLPLAKALIELHGGHLSIESEPEAGTTVRIFLPGWRRRSAGLDLPPVIPPPA